MNVNCISYCAFTVQIDNLWYIYLSSGICFVIEFVRSVNLNLLVQPQ